MAAGSAAAPAAAPGTLLVGGKAGRLLNDAHFSALRTALGYDTWLADALAGFDWGKMAAGGGKGGDKMARTPCKRLFIKEVSAGDNATLTHEGFLKAYVARVSTGKSLIVHIVAHLVMPDGLVCMVMNNWLPPVPDIKWARLYDLKGTRDDKTLMLDNEPLPEAHKRWYNLPWLMAEAACGVGAVATPSARRRYAQGKCDAFAAKLHLSPPQRESLLAALRDDAAFLSDPSAKGGLMDYSLIVGVAEDASQHVHPPGPAAPHAPPLACRHGGSTFVYYCGIIDFLQTWTGGKKVAHVIKACCAPHPISTVPPKAYAAQFVQHFEAALLGDGEVLDGAAAAAAASDGPAEAAAAAK